MSVKDFEVAAELVKNLKSKPSNSELLELYALFKQSIVGDINTAEPSLIDLKSNQKWKAWNKIKGLSQEDARKQYISKVDELVAKYGKN